MGEFLAWYLMIPCLAIVLLVSGYAMIPPKGAHSHTHYVGLSQQNDASFELQTAQQTTDAVNELSKAIASLQKVLGGEQPHPTVAKRTHTCII